MIMGVGKMEQGQTGEQARKSHQGQAGESSVIRGENSLILYDIMVDEPVEKPSLFLTMVSD